MRADFGIRPLASQADFDACIELQRETWGRGFRDAVPASILMVAQRVGGVTAGAFASDGTLAGFVFGITGLENGEIVHWSDMLAVRRDAQSLGIGRALKEFQRAAVRRLGGRRIYWTFDPLVARNAHLNLSVFGVHVVEYARDLYGTHTGSDLHRGIGTDRIVVSWPVEDAELAARRRETARARECAEFDDAPVAGDAERGTRDPGNASPGAPPELLRIAVPLDITAVQEADASLAASWRDATRKAFEAALGTGYRVDGFRLDAAQRRGFYLLSCGDTE